MHNSEVRRFKGILHRIKFLIASLVIIYASSIAFSSPLTTGNIFARLISVESSGGYGTLVFEMRNPNLAGDMPISPTNFKAISLDITGNPTQSVDIFYLKSVNITHYVRDAFSCVNVTTAVNANGTETDFSCGKVPEYTFVESRFVPLDNAIILPPGESLTIKMEVRWQPGLGVQSRDVQPSITLGGTEYVQNKWSFLNSNYSFYKWVRVFENASLDRYNQPVWINLSADSDFSACCSDTNYTDVFVSSNWTGTEVEIASDVVNGSIRGWSPNDYFLVFLVNLSGSSGNRSMNETYKIYANNTNDNTYAKYSAGLSDIDGTSYEPDCTFLINTTINAYHLCNGTNTNDRAGIRGVLNNTLGFRFADSQYISWGNPYGTTTSVPTNRYFNGSVIKSYRMATGSWQEFYTFYGDSPYFEITLLDPTLPAQGSPSYNTVVHTSLARDATDHIMMDNPRIQANVNDDCATIQYSLASSSHNTTNNMTVSLWREWRSRYQTSNTTYFCQLGSGSAYVAPMGTDATPVNLSNMTMHMSFKTLTNKGIDNQTNMKELIYQLNYSIMGSESTGSAAQPNVTPALTTTYTIAYDANSNRISGFGFYYEYNNFNQLVRVRNNTANGTVLEEYIYDENGDRIYKKDFISGRETYYPNKYFIRTINNSVINDTIYYYDKYALIARKDNDGKKFFYHPDHLGSTTLITNQTGQVVEDITYEPYGKIFAGQAERFAYTGKELDVGTGLEYYGARYYDPIRSQFTQPDSNLPDVYDPQQLNRYSYVIISKSSMIYIRLLQNIVIGDVL